MTVARHELVGLRAKVVASGHAGYLGVEGRVVDETMHTLTLETRDAQGKDREVVVPKAGQAFEFTLPGGKREVLPGEELAHRPEDRTRKARPRQDQRRGRM